MKYGSIKTSQNCDRLSQFYQGDTHEHMNAEKEIDFIVPDKKLAIQVSYSIMNKTTWDREVPPLEKNVL